MHIGCRILQNRFLLNTDRDEIEILAYTGNFFPKIWVDKFKVQTLFNSKIVDKTHSDQRKMRAYFTIPFMKTRTRSHKCFSSPLRINPHSLRFYRVLFVVKTTLIEGRGRNNQFTILHGQICILTVLTTIAAFQLVWIVCTSVWFVWLVSFPAGAQTTSRHVLLNKLMIQCCTVSLPSEKLVKAKVIGAMSHYFLLSFFVWFLRALNSNMQCSKLNF